MQERNIIMLKPTLEKAKELTGYSVIPVCREILSDFTVIFIAPVAKLKHIAEYDVFSALTLHVTEHIGTCLHRIRACIVCIVYDRVFARQLYNLLSESSEVLKCL